MTSSSIVAVWASSRSTMLASSPGRFLVGMMAATVSRVTSSSGGTIELTRLGDGAPTPAQRDHAERERHQHGQVDDLSPDDMGGARCRSCPVVIGDEARAGDADKIGDEGHHHRQRDDPEPAERPGPGSRSEEHTSELQSPYDLVCRLLLEKKKK